MSLFHDTGSMSPFEALCALAEDERPHPAQLELEQLGRAMMTETLDTLSNTVLEDHAGTIGEGLMGAFHSIAQRLQREVDKAHDEVKLLSRNFAGGEIDDVELQEATRKAHRDGAALMAIEIVRDAASETYTTLTGEMWSPWRGSVARTASTAAQIAARDALRAKRGREFAKCNPGDQVVVFRAAPQADTREDANRIWDALNWAHGQWPNMKLATTGYRGAEKLALKWAREKGVDVILAKVEKARHGRAAPFRVNDEMLELDPVLVYTLPNSLNAARAGEMAEYGPAKAAGEAAQAKGVRHMVIRNRTTH